MTIPTKYDNQVLDVYTKKHDFENDTFSFRLTSRAPVKASDRDIADFSEIATGNGYSPIVTDVSVSQVGGVLTASADGNKSITATGAIPTFRYVALYNDTANLLVSYIDKGADVNMTATDVFNINFPSNIFTAT